MSIDRDYTVNDIRGLSVDKLYDLMASCGSPGYYQMAVEELQRRFLQEISQQTLSLGDSSKRVEVIAKGLNGSVTAMDSSVQKLAHSSEKMERLTKQIIWLTVALLALTVVQLVMLLHDQKGAPKVGADVAAPAIVRSATVTEVFTLRTRCAELGIKINDEYDLTGRELSVAQKHSPLPLTQEQFSHYDPKTNRCYVELRVTPASGYLAMLSRGNGKALKTRDEFFQTFEQDYVERRLYDGQTGEELATLQKGLKGVAPSGFIKHRQQADWPEANTLMDNLMADDRKQ
jgi:hypothetical protein